MKIAMVATSWLTHVLPALPILRVLARGHEVTILAPDLLTRTLPREIGIGVRSIGADADYEATFADVLLNPSRSGPPRIIGLLDSIAANSQAALWAEFETMRPDVVLHEPMAVGAPRAAKRFDIPLIRMRYGPDLFTRLVDPDAADPVLICDPTPPQLRLPRATSDDRVLSVRREVSWPGSRDHLPPCDVLVSWGSTIGRLSNDRDLTNRVLRVGLDAGHRCVALGDRALDVALPSARVMVNQGGAGVTLSAALAGVPQLVIPALPDHRANAERVVAAGCGLQLDPDADDTDIARTLQTLLDGSAGFAPSLNAVAQSNSRGHTPEQVVGRIEELVA